MSPTSALWPSLMSPADQGRNDLCAVSAAGTRVRFADGRELLCGTSGLWNTNLGYGNQAIAAAAAEAFRNASYLSVFRFENGYARRAAETLIELCGADVYGRVMFSTSGGSANDLVMKLARQYQQICGQPQRTLVVGLRGSYHGLTFGAFALTGDNLGQAGYGVDQRLVRHVTPNDIGEITDLATRLGRQIAAVVVEPVLGSGAVPLTDEYLRTMTQLRDRYGFLLVADEVATGFGRTGPYFASQSWPAQPDVLIASKGLTNGTCAASAVLTSHRIAAAFTDSGAILTHAETQAGTPVSCAAVLATIEEMHRLSAIARGVRLSGRLDTALAELAARHPAVAATGGVGCFRSITLRDADGAPLPQAEVPTVVAAVRRAGAVVHPGVHGIQLIPALTYSDAELDELIDCVATGVTAALAAPATSTAAADRVPAGVR